MFPIQTSMVQDLDLCAQAMEAAPQVRHASRSPDPRHHFAVLKEANLITSRRENQQTWYSLNTSIVEASDVSWTIRKSAARAVCACRPEVRSIYS